MRKKLDDILSPRREIEDHRKLNISSFQKMKKSDDTASFERKEALSIINTENPHRKLPRVATLATRSFSDRNAHRLKESPRSNFSEDRMSKRSRLEEKLDPQFYSSLRSGETVAKSSNLLAAVGSLGELLAAICLYKAKYLSGNNSSQLFQLAKMTEIQETLFQIREFLLEGKKNSEKKSFSSLESKIDFFAGKNGKVNFFTSSIQEAECIFLWSLTQRTERQLAKLAEGKRQIFSWVGRYLNCLGRYFAYLSSSTSSKEN